MGTVDAGSRKIIDDDLNNIFDHTRELWEDLRHQNIFLAGGTGFFGSWLLECLSYVNQKLALGSRVFVLSRNPEKLQHGAPHLFSNPAIEFVKGDVRSFKFPIRELPYIIHAASSAWVANQDSIETIDTMVAGTRHMLDLARASRTKKFLFVSSGAVYGRQPEGMSHIPEEYCGGPDVSEPANAYAEGKRAAELLCAAYAKQFGVESKIARCFAFVGPYLPVDGHFAIGNFIRDGLRGGPIGIKGDGTPRRSYLYVSDLMIWLWTILLRGKNCTPYNVGSDFSLTILETAERVAQEFTPPPLINIASKKIPNGRVEQYVPLIRRAHDDLGLCVRVDINDALRRTIAWHRRRSP